MTPILSVRDLCLDSPTGRPLFRDLSLSLGRERVALVGRNGVGKSSLLELLASGDAPERGHIDRGGRIAFVRQDLSGDGASPGERRRKALEQARARCPELLLLDEPTRDLDRDGVEWLADWLRDWPEALLVVTHDRRLLRLFRDFVVVSESGCRAFEGSFDELVAELAEVEARASERYLRNLSQLLNKEQHIEADRRRRQRKKNVGRVRELGRCPARSRLNAKRGYKQVSQAKRMHLQRDRIGKMRDWVKSTRRALSVKLPLELAMPTLPQTGLPVILAKDLCARGLFANIDLSIARERIAVVGPNGAGKTTLLDMLTKERASGGGQVTCHGDRVAYVAQNAENWRCRESVLDVLARSCSPEAAVQKLALHGFPLALAARPLASLSPGERVRAALICAFQREPPIELLVLDEPTDDLDFVAVAALESILAAWPGGLVVVSHDPEFLDAIGIEHVIELGAKA
ncbi:MAG: ATP-binding cassette domain-containing protein [Polyangiaceae bacterium]